MTDEEIRADERRRVAALLRENRATFAGFAADKDTLVELIALALELSR